MARHPRTVKVLNKRYAVAWDNLDQNHDGECDPPDHPMKEIRLQPDLDPYRLATVLVHEMIHGAQWHIDEEFVTKFAEDVALALKRFGLLKLK